jgi:cytochrome c556
MRRITPLVVGLLVGSFCCSAGAESDTRQLVELPLPMQAHMLGNMRDHLATLNEIQTALAKKDFERVAQAAEQRLGVSSLAAHGAAHMAPYMPVAMQTIGTEMHRAATRLALAAQERDLDKSLAELAAVTRQCVACHSAYRIR